MQSVDYVVKDGTGIYRGGLAGEGGQTVLQVTGGQEISLNLRRDSVLNYVREGANLQIALADGRVIVLENYFSGAESKLYLSADGELSQVIITGDDGAATFGGYADVATWGKWSPSDELIFVDGDDVFAAAPDDEAVAMLAPAALAGLGPAGLAAAGLLGIAALADGDDDNGGGSSSTNNEDVVPTVDPGDYTITSDENTQTVPITGTAPAGSTVEVVIGDVVLETEADADGNWSVSTEPGNIPGEGDSQAEVTVTEPDGTVTELDGPTIFVDTIPPTTIITDGAVSTDDVWNEAEYEDQDGVLIVGEGEPNSTVALTIDGTTRETTVAEDGTWSIAFTSDEVADGDANADGTRNTPITIVSTDEYGNSITTFDELALDTETYVTADYESFGDEGTAYDDDFTANAEEVEGDGVTLTGTAEAGATVVIRVGGEQGTEEYTVTADASGNWELVVPEDEVTLGDRYDVPLYIYATDAEGNTAVESNPDAEVDDGTVSATGTVFVDTVVTNLSIDDLTPTGTVFNAEDTANGLTLTGTAEIGATEVYVSLNGDPSTRTLATVDTATGEWTVTFDPSVVPSVDNGEVEVQLEVTDIAGNNDGIGDDYGDTTTITIDNVTPETLNAGFITISQDNVNTVGFRTTGDGEEVQVYSVSEAGTATEVATTATDLATYTSVDFSTGINGTLGNDAILENSDEAGNSSSVYIALPDNDDTAVDVDWSSLEEFNIDAIDLSFLSDATLELTEAQILALSENGDKVTVSGEDDDTLTVTGATATGETETIDGQTYDVYTIGDDGATIVVDEDIVINT
ncbi:Ig-like domain-containing protein [Donghicola sp. XS_ASV15]|uniref:Ig-like domain-containing protein n=1 Tax=Donghicola sp. XS_ASV15 TaxID=3241295 RepID=UPI0035157DCF